MRQALLYWGSKGNKTQILVGSRLTRVPTA